MSVCTATVINSSHNIMGTNDRSYIIEFNDSIVNKIKSFKYFKSKTYKGKKSNVQTIKGIPYIASDIHHIMNIGIDADIHDINFGSGLMLSDKIKDCKLNYLIPYFHLYRTTPFQLYGQIKISILKNNKTFNSCFIDIDSTNVKDDLYVCYDYIALDELEKFKEEDKYKLLITMQWLSYEPDDHNVNILSDMIKHYSSYVETVNETELNHVDKDNDSTSQFVNMYNNINGFDWSKINEVNYTSLKTNSIEELTRTFKGIELLKHNIGTIIEDKKRDEQIEEHLLCHLCCSDKINTVFIPCGHMICCEKCSKFACNVIEYVDSDDEMEESNSGQCPMCKGYVDSIQKIYLN
jgi:hypothetical protein